MGIREVNGFKVVTILGVARKLNDHLVIVTRDNQGIMTALSSYLREEGYDACKGMKLVAYDPVAGVLYDDWVYKQGRVWVILAPDRYMPHEEGTTVRLYVLV